MSHLVFFADSFDTGCSYNLVIDDGNDLYFVWADGLFMQELPLLFRIYADFIGV